jgi:hypothetical protein
MAVPKTSAIFVPKAPSPGHSGEDLQADGDGDEEDNDDDPDEDEETGEENGEIIISNGQPAFDMDSSTGSSKGYFPCVHPGCLKV